MDLLRGLDVARFQNEIDWMSVPEERVFAYLGMYDWKNLVVDNQLERNVREGSAAGKVLGGYMRTNPVRWTPDQEARRMVGLLSTYDLADPGRLWPAVDIEPTGTPGDATVDWPEWTHGFFDAWTDLTDLPLMVYSSGSYFSTRLGGTEDWPDWVRLWVGHSERYSRPKGMAAEDWAGKTFWETEKAAVHQYTTTGQVPGITPLVDLDCLMPGVELEHITLQAA